MHSHGSFLFRRITFNWVFYKKALVHFRKFRYISVSLTIFWQFQWIQNWYLKYMIQQDASTKIDLSYKFGVILQQTTNFVQNDVLFRICQAMGKILLQKQAVHLKNWIMKNSTYQITDKLGWKLQKQFLVSNIRTYHCMGPVLYI